METERLCALRGEGEQSLHELAHIEVSLAWVNEAPVCYQRPEFTLQITLTWLTEDLEL